MLRRRFLDPGRIASVHTGQVGGSAVKHVTRGIPSDVPVPRNMTVAFALAFGIISGYDSKRFRSLGCRLFLRNVVSLAESYFQASCSLVSNKLDLIVTLDDEFEGIIAGHDAPNHAALGFALGKTLGVLEPDKFDDATQSAAATFEDVIGQPDHVVFFLVDGFGMNFVDTLPSDAYVRQKNTLTMCSTIPTSTGPNLMSLATGRWPGTHGNLGWDVHIPRLGERIQPLPWRLTRTGRPLHEVGFSPLELLFAPLIPYRNLGSFTFVVDNDLATSTTTQMYGQLQTAGYSTEGDSITQIVDHVLDAIANAHSKSFTYVYWTEVDGSAHTYGERHPITRAAVHRAAALVEALGNALTGRARLIVTADHGHLDSPREVWTTLTPSDKLSQHLTCVPAGEPRTLFFHTKPGAKTAFEGLFQERWGDRFTLMRSEDAIDMGIFGPIDLITDASRARMGDFFALSRGRWSIYASDTEREMSLESMHGGITTAESIVPFIVV